MRQDIVMLTLSEVLLVYSSVPSMYLPLWAHPSAPLFIEMNMNISHLHLHFAFLPVLPRLRTRLNLASVHATIPLHL